MVGRESRWQTIFFSSLFLCCWFYRNKIVHEGNFDFSKILFMFNQMVEDLLREGRLAGQEELIDQGESEIITRWKPPPAGWLKVNTDAAFNNGLAAIALVVRNDYGGMVLTMTKLMGCKNAWCVELAAVNWATKIMSRKVGQMCFGPRMQKELLRQSTLWRIQMLGTLALISYKSVRDALGVVGISFGILEQLTKLLTLLVFITSCIYIGI